MEKYYDEQRNLSQKLEFYQANKYHKNQHQSETTESGHSWGSPYLFAGILYEAKLNEAAFITPERLNVCVKSYKEKHGLTIDLSDLYDKEWLRNIFGRITIPGIILD